MALITRVVDRDSSGAILRDSIAAIDRFTPRIWPPGLGDLVATFAQPIAAAIDAVTERMLSVEHKTALAPCSSCARRHNKLNLLCPDLRTCPALSQLLNLLPSALRTIVLEAAAKGIKD